MSDRGSPKKKSEAFNNPFKAAITELKKKQAEPPKKPQAPPPPPKPSKSKRGQEEDDMSLFLSAMDGVEQITNRGEPPPPNPRLPEIIDENAEALAELAELVAGQGEFDVSDSTEYIEGAAPGIDARLLRSLRRGDFSIQGRLDLHGMTQAEARDAVDRFITDSRRTSKRCVLIIHGRGLNSKDQIPVLKESLRGWLSQKRVGKTVLAFATARPQDGGAGAVYVLLRR
ncbi:Smr/MutS family protein [Vitiosangium sp. GDMCC 1.1324]|uniref:Smr/MutS family protein n=1 Tax=Vitiosangium sp. (strain GDMCC 1.1324) TaxID=2138576 RepID=UPI000D33F184|nr:Smr/MutS family protein [Vitiosangium sp. GDMCC 1.1324]PTL78308.1 DNA mismatch repair protein MutS [Vitiosangium sp. GDMCC 1.1324]